MGSVAQLVTAEQLLEDSSLRHCELIRGEIVQMTPASAKHGQIAANLTIRLGNFVHEKKLGAVYTAEAGFFIGHDPDTVRAPDVAFVRAERRSGESESGFFQGPPDLAVEVLSPTDRASEVLAKVQDWLAAGSQAVWVVDPQKQTVAVFSRGAQPEVLTVKDRLTGREVLPGLELSVAEVFRE